MGKENAVMRLAVVEDDRALCAEISGRIRLAGHSCTEFYSGQALRRALQHESYDLVVVDQLLADIPADELLGWMRNSIPWSPSVILMTPPPLPDSDATPFNPADCSVPRAEAVQNIRDHVDAVLHRRFGPAEHSISAEYFGNYVFDSRARQLTLAGTAIPITAKAFDLALLFFRNFGRPLSRGHLTEAVWGRQQPEASRTLDAHISLIRSRLQLVPENGLRLGSIYRFGYKLERL